MARDALHMRAVLAAGPPPVAEVPAAIRIREIGRTDLAALGRLMWSAFQGTVDDEYATASEAAAGAADAMAGKWGPVIGYASLVAEADSTVVAATIVVRDSAHGYLPLLAYVMTDPAHQRRGVGRRLIEESMTRLAASGLDELHLAVARGNPAVRLYQRMGFRIVPRERT